jgi:hypothetical protein
VADQDSNSSDEDAAWRDLVARFDAPLTAEEPVPWPEREGDEATGVTRAFEVGVGRGPGTGGDGAPEPYGGGTAGAGADGAPGTYGDGAPGTYGDGATGAYGAGTGGPRGPGEPHVVPIPRVVRGARDRGLPAAADDDEHFIPPPPPPLPRLDPVAKGAWLALFGGPAYLVVATAAGWTVSGFAAFCAVAAFVAGFTILVLRMHEPGPGGPDDGDDGAVV